MRVLWLALMLAAATLVFGAWTSVNEAGPPTCTARDKASKTLVHRGGYALACGPGSATVIVKRTTYRIKGSRCFQGADGARLYFGAVKWDNPRLPARDSLQLVLLRRQGQPGVATVADGQLTLVTRAGTVLSGTPFGKAHLHLGLKRGTFTVFEHVRNGQTARRFTGNWNCG